MVTLTSKIDKSNAHSIVRKRAKESLAVMDLEDIPVLAIEADTRSLGLEDWGTKMGFDTSEILSEEREEERRRLSRK